MTPDSQSRKLLFGCIAGIFVCYFYYGIIQEKVTKTRYGPNKEIFKFTLSLVFCQCIINAIVGKIAVLITREVDTTPVKNYCFCAFSYIGAMFSSNYSLQHVNYPTQVLGKSVKPIPVMVLGVLWAKKKYTWQKYVFVSLITMGVVIFMMKDSQSSKSTAAVVGPGELFLLISLTLDGFTGAIQDDMRERFRTGPYSLMTNINIWSTLYLAIALVVTGEIKEFPMFANRHPYVLINMTLFGLTSAAGQMFIFKCITSFGPLMCSIITTTRKFFTILGSVIIFGNALSNQQWLGTLLVFSGLILDQIYGKSPKKSHTT